MRPQHNQTSDSRSSRSGIYASQRNQYFASKKHKSAELGSDGGAENANGIVKSTNSPSKIVNGLNEIESRYNHTGGQERNGYDSGGFFPASLDHPDNNLQRSEQKYVGFLLLYQTDELINWRIWTFLTNFK